MSTSSDAAATGRSSRTKLFVLAGLLIALTLAGVVSYYASSDPDGLAKVSEDEGFAESENAHELEDSPLAGYSTEDVDNDRLSGGMAGVIGVGATFVVAGGVTLMIRRRGQTAADPDEPDPDEPDPDEPVEAEAPRT